MGGYGIIFWYYLNDNVEVVLLAIDISKIQVWAQLYASSVSVRMQMYIV